jgi:hypothetical protein
MPWSGWGRACALETLRLELLRARAGLVSAGRHTENLNALARIAALTARSRRAMRRSAGAAIRA